MQQAAKSLGAARNAGQAQIVVMLIGLAMSLWSVSRAWASAAALQTSPPSHIVISEFRTRGPNGANDEFIELFNPTNAPVDISGWKIFRSNNVATTTLQITIKAGAVLQTGQHFLIINSNASGGYTGTVTGDLSYGIGITDDGGVALTLADGTTIVDQVGMSTGSAYKEDTTLPPLTTNVDRGYTRVAGGCSDTNNNAADFALLAPSEPQNMASTYPPCGGTPTPTSTDTVTPTDTPLPTETPTPTATDTPVSTNTATETPAATSTPIGIAIVRGIVHLQGRSTPRTAGTVALSDGAGHFAPVVVDFDAETGAFSATVLVDDGGSAYTLVATHALYLSARLDVTVIPGETLEAGTTTLRGDDTDNNGVIELSDLTCIGGEFGGAPSACESDINADGVVNILDLVLTSGNYGLASLRPW